MKITLISITLLAFCITTLISKPAISINIDQVNKDNTIVFSKLKDGFEVRGISSILPLKVENLNQLVISEILPKKYSEKQGNSIQNQLGKSEFNILQMTNILEITTSEKINDINVYDLSGVKKNVQFDIGSKSKAIVNLESLMNGVYIVVFNNSSHKFIINK